MNGCIGAVVGARWEDESSCRNEAQAARSFGLIKVRNSIPEPSELLICQRLPIGHCARIYLVAYEAALVGFPCQPLWHVLIASLLPQHFLLEAFIHAQAFFPQQSFCCISV